VFSRLLSFSVRARWAVAALTAVVAAVGLWRLAALPIDAVPDITNKQVQINTVAPALSPAEMEKRVVFPIETALAGIPGLTNVRSISRNGFSQVTAVFEERSDLYFDRQLVGERLAQARDALPEGVQPRIGPVTTGLGEVFMYIVDFAPARSARDGAPGWQSDGAFLTPEGERLTDAVARGAYLRTVQEWLIASQLKAVKGVAGVDSIGGYEKQYLVEPDPVRLAAHGLSYTDLARALEAANLSVGADFVQRGGEAYLVRADARLRSLSEIGEAVVATREGVPVAVKDVAAVRIGGDLRTGAASRNGHEVVIGTALMLIGGNSRIVAEAVGERLKAIKAALPPDVVVEPALDRSRLVDATIATVAANLAEGALLVAASLFLLLGNGRAALIAVLVIPVSFLMMAIGMTALGVSGNLMSLGALDFGLIVDGSVILIENGLRQLAWRQHVLGRPLTRPERLETVTRAAREMVRPTVFGQAIILLVFAPLLTFQGVEGKTFSPMAVTLMLALASAFVLSLTFVPAMLALLTAGPVKEQEAPAIARLRRAYAPVLARSVARPGRFILGGVLVAAAALAVFAALGQEFMPQLDEKNIALSAVRVPSTSLEQSAAMQRKVEEVVSTLPEVALVFSKTGTAEVATDPMPPNASDGFVILKPQSRWPAGVHTKADVLARIEARLKPLLGNAYEVSQPIQLRFNELIGGVRGDVAVKLYGDDLDRMAASAERIAATLRTVRGAADVRAEQVAGVPTLEVQFDRAAIARYGLTVEEVADTVSAALAGRPAGQVFEGDRRFDVVVRTPMASRNDLDVLAALPVALPAVEGRARATIPLGAVARLHFSEGLNQIGREDGKRRVTIQANVRGRDLGSFVREAQAKVAAVPLPPGSWLTWGGQYENLKAASARIAVVVPACFVLIFLLLYLALGDAAAAAVVFASVPMALAGGVFALALSGIAVSISAAVGFICLSGVAVLNGLVVMTSIRDRLAEGLPVAEAVREGTLERIRPVLMTGLVPAVGFIPMALAHGTGAEVQKPLATVVIGGLLSATALTLLVLPALAVAVLGLTRRPAPRPEAGLGPEAAE
jgi:cobalt-zinc-cadmium resistance protein CzcA